MIADGGAVMEPACSPKFRGCWSIDTIGAALKLRVIQGIAASATRSRKPSANKVSGQSDPFRKTSPTQLKAEKRKADPT
jgi:hypothetical protein